MQDWIVARQLNGTAGIAEVNSFGGELKQYEVSVNPNRLKAMGVSIPEIFTRIRKKQSEYGWSLYRQKAECIFYTWHRIGHFIG
jgi:cobalt-zinc-cadmium resistance protein CzcA